MDKMERRSYEYPRCLIGNDYAEVVLWTGIMAKPVKHHQKLSPLKVSSETKTRNHIEMCVYDPVDKHFNRLVDYDDNSRHSPHSFDNKLKESVIHSWILIFYARFPVGW